MSTKVPLSAIAFDAGTQVRAAIDQHVVAEYAEAMAAGAQFPPVVLIHDGSQHYLADGFHRFMAAQRNAFVDINADVRPGTKQDAVWFALGANRKNGKRLTSTDLQHAIRLAFATWPDKSTTVIAEQIGCTQQYVSGLRAKVTTTCNLPDRVTGKDGKSYPASSRLSAERIARVEDMLRAGDSYETIEQSLKIGRNTVRRIRVAAAIESDIVDRSRDAVAARREQMRALAADGNTSIQIADALGLSLTGCRNTLRKEHIDVPADRTTHHSRRHDSNRILDNMAMDAENLTADVNLIDFSDLDRAQSAGWIESLTASRDKLSAFIRRLLKEQQKHGQAA